MQPIRISLLGEFDIKNPRRSTVRLPLRAKLLLASVARSTSPVTRMELIERLWPDGYDSRTVESNLNNCISDAREPLQPAGEVLKPLRPERAVQLEREGRLKKSKEPFRVEVDVDDFMSWVQSESVEDNHRALGLIRGRLLHGIEHPWLEKERSNIDRTIIKAIRRVTRWPEKRASEILEEFYSHPEGTLDLFVSQRREDGEDEPAQVKEPGDMLLAALQAYYPEAAKLDTLRSLLMPQTPVYTDMSVRLYLRDTEDAASYELKYQVEFVSLLDEFIVALTTRATLQDLLIAECPQLNDAFAFSSDAARDSFSTSQIALTYYESSSSSGRIAKRDLRLRPLTDHASRKRYLAGIDQDSANDVVLLRAAIPGRASTGRRVELTITCPTMSRAEHYCFWVADRPSYIRRITLDFSGFSIDSRPRLHPLLGTVAHEIEGSEAAYDILVDNWLVKDQGVILVW